MIDTISNFFVTNSLVLAFMVGILVLAYCGVVIIGWFANIFPMPEISDEQIDNEYFIDELPLKPFAVKNVYLSYVKN